MTVNECITYCDNLKPNTFSNDIKTMWISEVEGIVQAEVMMLPLELCLEYSYADDKDTQLLVSSPYDRIYTLYVCAKIDYALEEYSKYSNTMEAFNDAVSEFSKAYCVRVNPAKGGRPKNLPMCFTMVRGTTPVLEFTELPVDEENVYTCSVVITQGGESVLSYELDSINYIDDTATCYIPQSDSMKLTAGIALVTLIITSVDGQRFETRPKARIKVFETDYEGVIT